MDGVIPLILLLMMDISSVRRHHPSIIIVINIQLIGSLLCATMLRDMLVSPYDPTFLAIRRQQLSVAGDHHQKSVILGKRGNPEFLRKLILRIAVLRQGLQLGLRIIEIKTVIVSLHPEILVLVDINTVQTALDTHLGEQGRGCAHCRFRLRVKHAEVHTLSQPESARIILPDVIHIVVTQRGGVVGIRIERTETVTVVTVQTIRRGNPHKTFRILEDIIDLRVRQAVTRIQAAELHVRNQRVSCIHAKAANKQQKS